MDLLEIETALFSLAVPEPNTGCLLWEGTRNAAGYGVVSRKVASSVGERMAHRAALALKLGSIPVGLFVCHRCDTPSCINPDHLYAGTIADNVRDCVVRRRHGQFAKTHCPRGHEYDRVRVRANRGPERYCGTCEDVRLNAKTKRRSEARAAARKAAV